MLRIEISGGFADPSNLETFLETSDKLTYTPSLPQSFESTSFPRSFMNCMSVGQGDFDSCFAPSAAPSTSYPSCVVSSFGSVVLSLPFCVSYSTIRSNSAICAVTTFGTSFNTFDGLTSITANLQTISVRDLGTFKLLFRN